MNFTGTDKYVATSELQLAVNAAIALEKPLLIKGEPGTGKTMLAEQISEALGMPLIQWHVKSNTRLRRCVTRVRTTFLERSAWSRCGSDCVAT